MLSGLCLITSQGPSTFSWVNSMCTQKAEGDGVLGRERFVLHPNRQAATSAATSAELDTLMKGPDEAYEAGDVVTHYRLERQLFFQFMMKLSFSLQALKNESSIT